MRGGFNARQREQSAQTCAHRELVVLPVKLFERMFLLAHDLRARTQPTISGHVSTTDPPHEHCRRCNQLAADLCRCTPTTQTGLIRTPAHKRSPEHPHAQRRTHNAFPDPFPPPPTRSIPSARSPPTNRLPHTLTAPPQCSCSAVQSRRAQQDAPRAGTRTSACRGSPSARRSPSPALPCQATRRFQFQRRRIRTGHSHAGSEFDPQHL